MCIGERREISVKCYGLLQVYVQVGVRSPECVEERVLRGGSVRVREWVNEERNVCHG